MKLPEIPPHDVRKGAYQHYKGGVYFVQGVGRHTETGEVLVAYVNASNELFMRPLAMFQETVIVDGVTTPRFKYYANH